MSCILVILSEVSCGIFLSNMLTCFIPLGVNVSDAYSIFHIELITICFTSFVFKTFFVNNLRSDLNTCVKLCVLLCLRGSRSEASKYLNLITNLYSLNKFNIADLDLIIQLHIAPIVYTMFMYLTAEFGHLGFYRQ